MNKSIVLIGCKGCGKSTVGAALAQSIGCEFIDSDSLIEAAYFADTGDKLSFRAIYQTIGAAKFRQLEQKVITELVQRDSVFVLATGGGCVATDSIVALLKQIGTIIFLDVPFAELLQRWQQSPPAFAQERSLELSLRQYMDERLELYKTIADYRVMAAGGSPEDLATEIDCILSRNTS